jgi:hypothetical protein
MRTPEELIDELRQRAIDLDIAVLVVGFTSHNEKVYSNDPDALQKLNKMLRADGR